VQLVASTAKQADGFLLNIQNAAVVVHDTLYDIAVGGSGSEVAIVENVLFSGGGGDAIGANAYFPIPIPAGSRVSARAQASDAGITGGALSVMLADGGVAKSLSRRRAFTYGADATDSGGTPADAGASANTKGGWAQLSASVTEDFDQCVICVGNRNVANASQNILLDLGVGAALSETVIVPDIYYRGQVTEEFSPKMLWTPCEVKAGQRLAVRIQSSNNASGTRIMDVVVIGFSSL
jgi:hypothetical protein